MFWRGQRSEEMLFPEASTDLFPWASSHKLRLVTRLNNHPPVAAGEIDIALARIKEPARATIYLNALDVLTLRMTETQHGPTRGRPQLEFQLGA